MGAGEGGGDSGAEIPEHVSADDREMRTTCVARVRAPPAHAAPPLFIFLSLTDGHRARAMTKHHCAP